MRTLVKVIKSPKLGTCMISKIFLSVLLCAPLLACPNDEKTPKIEGTANPEKFPAPDPDEALLATIQYPEEMTARVYAREPDALNVTAIAFDEKNRLYLSETHRFDRGIEDNRRNQHWLRDDIALTSTSERLAMYRKHEGVKPLSYYTEHSDKIRVLVDEDADGKLDKSQIFADGFNDPLDGTAAGIFAANGKVYFACIPHVWILEDNDSDLKADKRESLQEGYGISVSLSGHDLNGFSFGPDGRIYFTIGDRGYNLKTSDGRHLYDQYAGAIFRMEPDGSGLEIVHSGLRNPKEIAFDQYGSGFSVDNNADMGDKARLIYMVEGGDSGWHRGNQNLRNFRHAIDVSNRHQIPWMVESGWDLKGENRPASFLPPITHLSTGPSGLTYNPGTGLAKKWDEHFFICDYCGGRSSVIGFKVSPSGASFSVTNNETFIKGFLNTDMEFGYDGRIYVSDFTGSWRTYDKGTIFVFENPEELAKPIISEVRSLFANGFEKLPPKKLAELLKHTDHRVRQRAQFALAKNNGNRDLLAEATAPTNDLFTRLHGLWGLGQLARLQEDKESQILLNNLCSDKNWRIRGQAAQALGQSNPKPFRATLADLLTDKNLNTRMHAAIALGKSGDPSDVPALVSVLHENKNSDPYLHHGAIYGLELITKNTNSAATIISLKDHPSPAVRRGAVMILRRLKHAGIASFLNDSDPTIAIEAIQAINDNYIEEARSALARSTQWLGKSTPMIDYRIINAIYRVGGSDNLDRILKIASDTNRPDKLRMEALFALQRWENPPAADPTTGKHRPLSNDRSLEDHKDAIATVLNRLLKNSTDQLLAEVIRTTESFEIAIEENTLLAHFANPKNDLVIRLAALENLQNSKNILLASTITKTLNDPDKEIRVRSLDALAQIDPKAATAQAQKILSSNKIFDLQRAFATLGGIKNKEATQFILTSLQTISAQPAAVHLDIIEAAKKQEDAKIVAALAAYQSGVDQSNPLATHAVTLEGGDINQGRFVFYNHGAAQCTRCHKGQRGRKGGIAGPDLWNVGSLHGRDYLLESLVKPNAHIAPGYGMVSVTLRDNTIAAGNLHKEDSKKVIIADITTGEKTSYAREKIEEMTRPASTMPPMSGILKKSEIRDLIAYLASLKDSKKKEKK